MEQLGTYLLVGVCAHGRKKARMWLVELSTIDASCGIVSPAMIDLSVIIKVYR